MFSVIIPLYNKAAYIEKAIQSVLSQTFREFELIVVDDGSTDNSMSVVERILKSPLGVPIAIGIGVNPPSGGWGGFTQRNQGVSIARNNGVKLAKYDYIAFLDADDWWEPTYLEEMKNLIEAYPEAGIYGCNYYMVKNGRLIRANIGVEPGFDKGLINYCQVYAKTMYMPLTSITSVLKKTIFELENGFNPSLKLGEDFDLWLRIAMKYPVAFLNKPLANYNQDVEISGRAIGEKLYKPEEHMLFSDFGKLNKNLDFRLLFERLTVYGLLPYYLAGKNKKETDKILSGINWKQQAFKYRLYYRILPKAVVRFWMRFLKIGSFFKKKFNDK